MKKWNEKEAVIKQKIDDLGTASAKGYEAVKTGVQRIWEETSTMVEKIERKTNEIKNEK